MLNIIYVFRIKSASLFQTTRDNGHVRKHFAAYTSSISFNNELKRQLQMSASQMGKFQHIISALLECSSSKWTITSCTRVTNELGIGKLKMVRDSVTYDDASRLRNIWSQSVRVPLFCRISPLRWWIATARKSQKWPWIMQTYLWPPLLKVHISVSLISPFFC